MPKRFIPLGNSFKKPVTKNRKRQIWLTPTEVNILKQTLQEQLDKIEEMETNINQFFAASIEIPAELKSQDTVIRMLKPIYQEVYKKLE